ncbi:hypothetical protein JTE90_018249 [Oedothorax gibbosus]|uniref:Uncharacterized protein n=1 Tax=Oedothorax gibbosus TaxID=931172 RepID=A0AAV6UBK7_9ARAC|nr:hypothetical protein JTE90_018249 [Oedothorax gibbosus]
MKSFILADVDFPFQSLLPMYRMKVAVGGHCESQESDSEIGDHALGRDLPDPLVVQSEDGHAGEMATFHPGVIPDRWFGLMVEDLQIE